MCHNLISYSGHSPINHNGLLQQRREISPTPLRFHVLVLYKKQRGFTFELLDIHLSKRNHLHSRSFYTIAASWSCKLYLLVPCQQLIHPCFCPFWVPRTINVYLSSIIIFSFGLNWCFSIRWSRWSHSEYACCLPTEIWTPWVQKSMGSYPRFCLPVSPISVLCMTQQPVGLETYWLTSARFNRLLRAKQHF